MGLESGGEDKGWMKHFSALPLSYSLEDGASGLVGFEPTTIGFQIM